MSSTHVHLRVIIFCSIKLHTFKSVVCVPTVTSDSNVIARGSVLVGPPLAGNRSIFLFQEPADGGKLNFLWRHNHILRLQSHWDQCSNFLQSALNERPAI